MAWVAIIRAPGKTTYVCGCNARYDSECRCDEPEDEEYEENDKPVTAEVVSS